MAHCVFYRCLMNGVRTLAETDRRPAVLCPVCRAKLCWSFKLDPIRDDSLTFATTLKAAKHFFVLEVYPGVMHAFFGYSPVIDEAKRAGPLWPTPCGVASRRKKPEPAG